MKPLPVVLLPGAIADGRDAHDWYFDRDAGAAKGFEHELDAAIEAIADAPDRWPQWLHGTRRYLFRRYPFFVVYKVHDTAIWVVAIAHAKRRPDYWRTR